MSIVSVQIRHKYLPVLPWNIIGGFSEACILLELFTAIKNGTLGPCSRLDFSRRQWRLKIEKNPNLSWGNIHGEYWLLHVNSPSTSGQHSYQTSQQQTYVPRIYTQNKMQFSSNQVNPQNNLKPRANQQSSNSSMYCRYYNNGTDCPYFPRSE